MRKLVIGDIHGGYRAMLQVLERANFDKDKDLLIGLGDYADGWPDVYDTIEYLRNLPNFKGVIGNHDCFSDDTQALTDKGWKDYKDITLEDKILSLNTETGKLCWDSINKIIVKEVDENLYHFSNQHIDMLITKTHRVLHQKRTKEGWGEFKYDTIGNLNGRVRIPTSGFTEKKGIDLTDNEIKFIAWILTDGGIAKSKLKNYYTIYQSKEDTKKRIRTLLEELNYSYTEVVRNRNIKEICGKKLKSTLPQSEFAISSETSQIIKEFLPDKYPFPSFLLDMNKRQFDIFLNEVILGDGSYCIKSENSDTAMLYGKKEFLDNIQMLCIQNGKRAVVVKDNRGDYRLNISDYTGTSFDVEDKIKEVPYKGTVWCLSVPQTNFMVRRNGKAFISGNSWLLDFLSTGYAPHIWTSQGGLASLNNYQGFLNTELADKHKTFLNDLPYHLVIDNKLFVHGGVWVYDGEVQADETSEQEKMWDRSLFMEIARQYLEPSYKEVFSPYPFDEIYIGHTTTQGFQEDFKPVFHNSVGLLDQGGGWDGKLTVMDINTHEYWQSDFVYELYPEIEGRK